jgi:hypothetical protein
MLKPSPILAAVCIACFSLASHADTVVIGDFDDGTMQNWARSGNNYVWVEPNRFTGSGYMLAIGTEYPHFEFSLYLDTSLNPDLFLLNTAGPQILEFDVFFDPVNDWVGDGSMAWPKIAFNYDGGWTEVPCAPNSICAPPYASTTSSGLSAGHLRWDFVANGTPLRSVPGEWANLHIGTNSNTLDALNPITQGIFYIDNITITYAPGWRVFAPVSVVATSEWNGDPPHAKKENLIDGSGLSGAGPVESQTHDDQSQATSMWHAGQQDAGLGGPTGAPPVVFAQAVIFDLGYWEDLGGAYIWNHNQADLTARGVDQFEVLVSSETDPLTATFTSVGTFNLDEAMGGATEPPQFVPFSATAVRLVRFYIYSAHSGLTNDWVGLSEVRFLPEPSAPLQLAIGAGTLLLLARWRRRPSHRPRVLGSS